ncbi:RNA-directed DNA polymerase, eukaryota, reverse transcriptase zinc-binding domain protein [Tanacetum coccineum]|uniref:F-actin-capping protein subunit beta n=1 Tax=Tanacetum coccineum TaxID=301880 RepID=A0ABQ5G8Y4_9ASTR
MKLVATKNGNYEKKKTCHQENSDITTMFEMVISLEWLVIPNFVVTVVFARFKSAIYVVSTGFSAARYGTSAQMIMKSIPFSVAGCHLCNMGKMIEELEGKLRNQLDQVYFGKTKEMVLQRMESIRCHFFNGVDHNGKKPIWVKWCKVLASKEKGGLGVSSFYALNRALLFKWVWRFRIQRSSLWARVIKGIHGEDGKLVYALESCKNVTVTVKMSHENVGYSLRRIPREGVEQVQFLEG